MRYAYYRVTIRPGFPGFVPVLWGMSRCPDDLCKIAKLFRFFTCEEGKEIVNLDLRNVSTRRSYKHWPGPVYELPGVEPPTSPCRPPYLWSKFDPGGSSFNPPPKFC